MNLDLTPLNEEEHGIVTIDGKITVGDLIAALQQIPTETPIVLNCGIFDTRRISHLANMWDWQKGFDAPESMGRKHLSIGGEKSA